MSLQLTMSTHKASVPQPLSGIAEETSEVVGKRAGVTIAAEESGSTVSEAVSERAAGGRRMSAALWQKWGNVRSKLRNMGCVLLYESAVLR